MKREKQFIAFSEIKKYPEEVIVVDAHHPQGFTLSHWRGASVPAGCEGDTSTEIVLKAIEKDLPELSRKYVTNNHYDIDGFLGVWSLFNPEKALKHKDLLIEIAQIGDFREIDFSFADWKKALRIVCLLNHIEEENFYPPFGASEVEEKEIEACIPKYHYFLQIFGKLLESKMSDIENTSDYDQVLRDLKKISHFDNLHSLRIQVVYATESLHYYALYSQSQQADMVISIYPDNRYELEYKYTSWVQTNRLHYPRISLTKLTQQLNELESSGLLWEAENYTDTAPILRLTDKKLTKKERYQSPSARRIHGSSIDAEQFVSILKDYFRKCYQNIQIGTTLDWKEVRKLNQALFE